MGRGRGFQDFDDSVPARPARNPMLNNALTPYPSMPTRYPQRHYRPPIPGMPRAGPPPPSTMPVKADRHAEWRQRAPHHKAHGGSSVEALQKAQIILFQSQRAAAESKNGVESNAGAAHDLENTRSVEAIQSVGDDSSDNANDNVSGTETWETPSEDLLPPNLGLAGSLNYVANKNFGLDVLSQSSESAQFTGFLLDTIERLEKQLAYFRAPDGYGSSSEDEDEVEEKKEAAAVPRSQILHGFFCNNSHHKHYGIMYEDEPRYGSKDPTGKVPVYNLHAYLAKHLSICFILFKAHSCTVQKNNKELDLDFMNPEPTASEGSDRLRIISPLLQKALEAVAQFKLKKENDVVEMIAPYNFLFHHRKRLTALFEESGTYKAVLAPLLEFLDKNYKEEYESAEALFQRGMVSARHIGKLFKPNQMVLAKSQGTGGLTAFVLLDYPDRGRKADSKRMVLRGWSWRYNGTELLRDVKMEIIDRPSDDETAITDLDLHPVEFAHQSDIEELQRRGQKFWDHKAQVLVNYTGWDKNREHYYVSECVL